MRRPKFILEICVAAALLAATASRISVQAQTLKNEIGFHPKTPKVAADIETRIHDKFGIQTTVYVTPVEIVVVLGGADPSITPIAGIFAEVKGAFGDIPPGKTNIILVYDAERLLTVFGPLDAIFCWLDSPNASIEKFKLMLAFTVEHRIAFFFDLEAIWGKPIKWV